jgi:hypothetical protein
VCQTKTLHILEIWNVGGGTRFIRSRGFYSVRVKEIGTIYKIALARHLFFSVETKQV